MKATTMINERRKYPRATLKIPTQVYSYNCEAGSFYESTETINVSPLGLAFPLAFPVTIDDILLIQLDMPRRLRLYDFDKPQYQIYAQVRRIQPVINQSPFIGIAFVSKDPPSLLEASAENIGSSYLEQTTSLDQPHNTSTATLTMEIGKMAEQHSAHDLAGRRSTLNQSNEHLAAIPNPNERGEVRLTLRLGLTIRGVDKNGQPFMEWVQTADVSRQGLCFVVTQQNLVINSIVEIVAVQGRFAAQGCVCHITHNPETHTYHVGVRLLGMSNSWLLP
jgi:hypothetical protein